jgi:hypothetical protein
VNIPTSPHPSPAQAPSGFATLDRDHFHDSIEAAPASIDAGA